MIERAAHHTVERLLEDGKILCCGNGSSANIASIFTQNLALPYAMERPGFPATMLSPDVAIATATLDSVGANHIFSQQISALGSSGDVLVVLSQGRHSGAIVGAIQQAHQSDMSVVAISATHDADIDASLNESDFHIAIESDDPHRIIEIQLLCVYALCDLIETILFGAGNS